jgi:hypothetical protein
MDRRTKDWPWRADSADRGTATVTPARRAPWSARVKTHFSLPALTVIFLQKFELM